VRIFYRLMKRNPPALQDVLSQAALRQPCPRPHDPDFVRKWEGLSVFADAADVRALGIARNWKPGIYIATLQSPTMRL
jgi:RNA polymerase subunit RPABC4/transcription elongation factor Spt4